MKEIIKIKIYTKYKTAFTIMTVLQAFCVSAAICIALIFLLQVGTWEDVIYWEKTFSFRPLGLLPGFLWTSTGLR